MATSKNKQHKNPPRGSGSGFRPIGIAKKWLENKHPVLKFILGFVGCMALFYLFYYSDFYKNQLEIHFLHAQASVSSLLLNLLGHDTVVVGGAIGNADFSVNILNGCDGLEAMAIFLSGLLIYPASIRHKLQGVAIGVPILLVLNVLRIAGLYLIGLNFSKKVFDVVHVQGGFVIFTMVSVLLWFAWMSWVSKQPVAPANRDRGTSTENITT